MTFKLKIIFSLTLVFYLNTALGQTVTTKELADKWNINFSVDSLTIGDTIVFKKDKKHQNYYLKSNNDLKRHTWYAHCGNKYFSDYFTPKPPDWETIGSWNTSIADKKTQLTMNYGGKVLTFILVNRDKKQFRFVLLNKQTK